MMYTIAEMRARSLEEFNNNFIHDLETARHIVNVYYRFAILSRRNLELDTEYNQGKRWYELEQEKEERARERLEKLLQPFGLMIGTPWITPMIERVCNAHGATEIVYNPHFY